jgi:CRP-like cAMP-binding protein
MSKGHIVLIEDNLNVRENIAEILELDGYEVSTAADGSEGIRLLREKTADLILCDIMMPKLDGYGVLHIINRDNQLRNIPFIFLTAKSEKEDFRKGMNMGADDYIAKPFAEHELLNTIQLRLEKRNSIHKNYDQSDAGLDEFLTDARAQEGLNHLAQDREKRRYKKKAVIFQEGDRPHFLYLLEEGKVKTFKISEDGKELITQLYSAGDYLGYMNLIQDSAYDESAQALEDCVCSVVPKSDFQSLLFENRDVSAQFIKILASQLHHTEERLLSQAYDSVRMRVARGLLMIAEKYGKEEEGIIINLLRDDLASVVGTAKETLIRTLGDFKQEGLIELGSGGQIQILQKKGLEHILRG